MTKKSSRRDFVKRSASVVLGAVVLPQIIPSTAMGMGGKLPPSDRIVMGAIGVGSQGTSNLRNFIKLKGQVQYVAICDVDTGHLAQAKGIVDEANNNNDCRTYGDFREFLEKEKIDAVQICLPDHWDAIIHISSVNKKLDVYGEKPICRAIKEGQALVSAVKKNNVIWQTGQQQRSTANFHHAAELVINGRIGKIKSIVINLLDGAKGIGTPPIMEVPKELNWDMWLGPALKVPYRGICHYEWRRILDYSGGRVTDWAGHHIDMANWGAGLDNTGPIEISGKGVYPREGIYDVPIEFDILCKYANGIEMRIANQSRLIHELSATTWYGEKGWINVDRGSTTASDPKILEEVIGDDEIRLYKSDNHHQNFIDCVRSRKETIAPIGVAFRAISVALLGEIATTTGQTIKWDPDKEEIIGNPMASRLLSRPYREPWVLPTV